ncbi:hypothetical protein NKE62_10560 [Akkermansia sp. Marseille-P9185]|uniref:hypothetical protein n=2 Tax=Akkermansia TaxID=239934 RepID=UPI00209BFDBE|nr:hypothetical protein [Akkermansia massiliensis]MCO8187362.1 hypothetical protein [Akkermansia massiliensis]
MQIKTRSTLPTGAFFMQVVVLLDLVVLVCVLTIMTSRVGMAYGYEVKAPSSRFLMNIVGDVEFISVTAGDQPAFYIGNRLIEGGLPGVSAELDRISRENEGDGEGRMGIALRLDSAVSRALEQQLVDMVLAKGMTCYIAAEPAD